jgi:hypothetical protein
VPPPRLVVFGGPAKDLFRLLRPQLGSQRTADAAYAREGPSDKRFLGVRAPSDPPADWPAVTTRLIPILVAWATYFLDKPDFGVAVRQLDTLVESVSHLEQVQFAPTINSLLLGCYRDRQDKKSAYSALSSDWDPLPVHPKTKAWMQDRWTRFTSNKAGDLSDASDSLPDSEDKRKMPARRSIRAPSPRMKSAPDPTSATMQGPNPKQARTMVAPAAARPAAALTATALASPAGFTLADLGPLVTRILQAQAESNLQLHQSFQTNMLANIRSTATALVATGGSKESKLSDTKLRILQACLGHGDLPTFVLSKFYAELDKDGITADNCGRVLRRLCVTVHGSANPCNIHISPKVISAAKTLNFSANNNRTFVGCTTGITSFAVPWKLADAVNEALANERYFDEATLKSPADIKKHVTSGTFEVPTNLQGLTRVLTNYVRLLEVMFESDCLHLINVIQLWDGLVRHERVFESSITPPLMINLLWKVHQDSRQFFAHCEKWESGKLLPHSYLDNTVRELIADINISMTITCPVTDFLGTAVAAPKREAREAPCNKPAGSGHGMQATKKSSIPAICAATVQKFNRLHPTMDISSFVRKSGIRYSDVKVGSQGDCINFGLLGRCSETCRYRHKIVTVPDDHARTIKAELEKGMAKLSAESSPA